MVLGVTNTNLIILGGCDSNKFESQLDSQDHDCQASDYVFVSEHSGFGPISVL